MDINSTGNIDLLVKNFLKGDRKAFEKVYKLYHPLLYNYGCQFRIDSSVVDDFIQDIFIDIWNSRERLNIKQLKPYLFKCLRNKLTKQLAKEVKEKDKAEKYWREEFEISYDPASLGIDTENKTELEKKLAACIEELSPRQRELIFLIFYNDMSYIDAADVLKIKIKTAYNQIHNSISTLRKSLLFVYLGFGLFQYL
ncbi:RNA polymerase sigma factor [Chondrinema litorale]|uniref:RNA polymerase sigma factor n=1 Tax=Chondrinema litorale TaxID=2994555 RepID=UPI002542777A|nr:sigma-70 family RNA polymerase sigma factor [Chondrinema litorale]UZR97818.1 sigma-70 family RNA polymerase sigma factor [Chondrinema litorale]